MKSKSILVTGAAGCIGSNLCRWLLDNKPDYTVIALDDLSGGYLDNIPKKCVIYIRDVGAKLDDIFLKYDVKIIYHCAAIASEALSPFMRMHYYTNNIVNSANVINNAITYKVDRLVFFSSMAVYGDNEAPFHEDQIPRPNDPYGAAKLCVEHDLMCAKNMHNLKWTIVRPHSVYGPGQLIEDRYRNVLGIFQRQIINNEPVTIYGNGEQKRAFTYVTDIMEPLWMCAVDPNTLWQTFNIGNDVEMTIQEALTVLEDVTGVKPHRKYLPMIHEIKNAYSDHSKAVEVLGLECTTSLYDGLRKMWDWAIKQDMKGVKNIDKFEIREGLYEMWKK